MIILGLTGSIGMGKSTTAEIFQDLGVSVHDADAAVHELLDVNGGAVEPVAELFPDCVEGEGKDRFINRKKLGQQVFGDKAALKRLEDVLHPLVRAKSDEFVAASRKRREKIVVLDIPLLFESGSEKRVDYTICVTAPDFVQAQRVLSRPGMTEEKFQNILKTQMRDAEKRRRADFVVFSSQGKAETRKALQEILRVVQSKQTENEEEGDIDDTRDCAGHGNDGP